MIIAALPSALPKRVQVVNRMTQGYAVSCFAKDQHLPNRSIIDPLPDHETIRFDK
jgi:hypothetical protein